METREIKLFDKQWEAFNCQKRFILCSAGVQGGKTFLGTVWLLNKIRQFPDENHLICAPTYKILQQSTLPKFRELCPSTIAKFYEQDSYFSIVGGTGKIFVRSGEDPDSLEGMTLRSAWLDEAGNMKKRVWVVVQARTAIKQGQVLMTTSPYTMNWIFYDIFKKGEGQDKDFGVFQWMSINNPYFPKEEFERSKSTLSGTDFDRRYRGLWRRREGLVYQEFNPITMTFEGSPNWPMEQVIGGVDWGYNHPTAIVVVGIGDRPSHTILDEWYKTKQSMDAVIAGAKELKERHNIKWFYADSARPEYIKAFNDAGLPTLEGNKEVAPGVNEVRLRIKTGNLLISKSCKNLLEELEMYAYNEDAIDVEEPVKQYDDALDALRYAVYSYKLPAAIVDSNLTPLWKSIKKEVREIQSGTRDDSFDTPFGDELMY
jgi:PBSX family phage terminase large subunit